MATLANTDPFLAEDFENIRFEGIVLSLHNDATGLIACFPYADRPHCDMTVVFHRRFVRKVDHERLLPNACVEFSIGMNPISFGQCIFSYVALDIVVARHGFTIKYIPVTSEHTERSERGRIIVAPEGPDLHGFIYSPFDRNTCRLDIGPDEHPDDFREGIHVRFNKGGYDKAKDARCARDVVPVAFHPDVTEYCTADNHVRYNAKRMVAGRKLKIDEDRCIVFKFVQLQRDDFQSQTDLSCLLDEAETYLNAFLNTNGGEIYFGVADDGTVRGQPTMNENKRNYIRSAIGQRLRRFNLPVSSEFYSVEFKEVIDVDGYCVVDTFVIIMHACQMHAAKLSSCDKVDDDDEKHIAVSSAALLLNPLLSDADDTQVVPGQAVQPHLPHMPPPVDIAFPIEVDAYNINADVLTHSAPKFTTPELNAKPIPEDTAEGVIELRCRVQAKINAMMSCAVYMLDPRWTSILTISANMSYASQRLAWMLMKALETEKIQQFACERQLKFHQKQRREQQRLQLHQHQTLRMFGHGATTATFVSNASNAGQNQLALAQPPMVVRNEEPAPTQINAVDDHVYHRYENCFPGARPKLNVHGLPVLSDKSKFKMVACEYCTKMGWNCPVEMTQLVPSGFRATVSFGRPGHEKSESGDGSNRRAAIYVAYEALVPRVIPKPACIEMMMKFVPGYTKVDQVSMSQQHPQGQNTIMKHPKMVLFEWATRNRLAMPKTTFSEAVDWERNLRWHTARVTFCGKTVEGKASRKKDAEEECFDQLLSHVLSGSIGKSAAVGIHHET